MKKLILPLAFITLTGCSTADLDTMDFNLPFQWTHKSAEEVRHVEAESLEKWWEQYEDVTLNRLVEQTLQGSPDRKIAEARLAEARGLRRTARSSLLPQISASAAKGREDTGFTSGPEDFYDARFDASFEIDIFGQNRKRFSAADAQIRALEAEYHDVSLTLIGEVIRTYIDFRASQAQLRIAEKNLQSQERTLELINDMYELGSAPKLDIERAENLVNTTRASIPEFQRQADNARLRLSVLMGELPEDIRPELVDEKPIPGVDIEPVLMAPAKVLTLRPDIKAATANLVANTRLAEASVADLFPTLTLSGFYGIADGGFVDSTTIWNVAIGAAVSLIDFGRIEGQIDAAKARQKQAYELYRKTVLEAVTEMETALSDYANLRTRVISLQAAYENADESLNLSTTLYKEGEIAFLDVLDSQRNANNAEAALISAQAALAESLTRIYKSLGVY